DWSSDVCSSDLDEAGTGRQPHVLDLDDVVRRGPAQTAIGAQRVLGLGHADGCIAVAFLGELAQLALDLGRQVDIGGLVDPLGDGADLLLQWAVEFVAVARTRGGIGTGRLSIPRSGPSDKERTIVDGRSCCTVSAS